MTGKRLVLISKSSGKIASRKDQAEKAIVLKAVQLSYGAQAGGIPAMLLPRSQKEQDEITSMGAIYDVSVVKTRPGKKSGTSDRKALREALKNDDLICQLAVQFGKYVGNKSLPHSTSKKAFIHWLNVELKDKTSSIYQIVSKQAPVLLEVEPNDRWWADAFAERRKTQS